MAVLNPRRFASLLAVDHLRNNEIRSNVGKRTVAL